MKKVLIITTIQTHPTNMGNSFAILAQAKKLQDLGCDVYLLYVHGYCKSEKERKVCEETISVMRKYWGNKLYVYSTSRCVRFLRNLRYRISIKIRNWQMGLYQQYPFGVENVVKDIQSKHKFDICIVNYVYMTKIFDYVKFPKMACFTHDTYAYKNQHAGKNNLWINAHQEACALQKCTDVLAIQEEEMNYFKVLAPRCRHYIVYTPYTYVPQPIAGNHNIVFLSGKNEFNQNGLRWFIKEIFPIIQKKVPDVQLLIAGGICNAIKEEYSSLKGITLCGYVDDPKDFFAFGDVAINPTFQGTGLKIKTFESMAYDKVTLVHPHSTAGIYDKLNAPLFSSDIPGEWVRVLCEVWNNKDLIADIKKKNKNYISMYNEFIESEYCRFIK